MFSGILNLFSFGGATSSRSQSASDDKEKHSEDDSSSSLARNDDYVTHTDPYARLSSAITRGDVKTVKAILETRISIDVNRSPFESYQSTFLHLAVLSGSPHALDMVKLLLAAGSDPNGRDLSGGTVLHLAANLKEAQAIDLLYTMTKAGADINSPDKHGTRVLHLLCDKKHLPHAVSAAVHHCGARWSVRGITLARMPLHLLAIGHCAQAVTVAVESGADLVVFTRLINGQITDCVDAENSTPLHLAVRCLRTDTVRELLSGGACVNLVDSNGETPLDIATSRGFIGMTKLLNRHWIEKEKLR